MRQNGKMPNRFLQKLRLFEQLMINQKNPVEILPFLINT